MEKGGQDIRISSLDTYVSLCLGHTYVSTIDIRTSTSSTYVHRHHRHTYIDTIDIRTS